MTDPVETSAPERIWAIGCYKRDKQGFPLDGYSWGDGSWSLTQEPDDAEYIRADLVAALVAEQNKSLTDGIREAIRLAEQPHYGDSDTALEHYSEAIDILRKLV